MNGFVTTEELSRKELVEQEGKTRSAVLTSALQTSSDRKCVFSQRKQ